MDSEPSTLLNLDIMHVIVSYATRRVISGLMKTCHTFNSEGAKYLLRRGVSLGCEVELWSFMCFLLARGNPEDCFRRVLFFDKLSLHFDCPSPEIGIVLTQLFEIIIPTALNFTSLKISEAEDLLTTHPPLRTAIAKLTTLEALELSSAGECCAKLLRTLQSKLVIASITFGDIDREQEDEDLPGNDSNPILLLRSSQSTLQSLDTNFSVSSFYGPQYPNLTDLSLSYLDLPIIEDYIRAFPNVCSLSAFECRGYGTNLEDWEECRMTSIEYQARYGTWRSLRYYNGSVLILWTFGLKCHIPSIELDFEDYKLDLAKLDDVLQDVRPSDLLLKLPEASCLLDEDFGSALRTDSLREVELHVNFNSRKDATLFVGDILDSLVDAIRASSMTSFNLYLNWSWVGRVERMDDPEGLPVFPFEFYLQDMDVDAYANAVFARVASLQQLQVSLVGPRWYARQADRIRVRSDGSNEAGASDGNVEV